MGVTKINWNIFSECSLIFLPRGHKFSGHVCTREWGLDRDPKRSRSIKRGFVAPGRSVVVFPSVRTLLFSSERLSFTTVFFFADRNLLLLLLRLLIRVGKFFSWEILRFEAPLTVINCSSYPSSPISEEYFYIVQLSLCLLACLFLSLFSFIFSCTSRIWHSWIFSHGGKEQRSNVWGQ